MFLLDGVELSGADNDDIAGRDRALLKVRGYDAPAFFNDDKFDLRVPVQGHSGKIARDGAEIGVVGKIRRGVGLRLVVILVFTDIHKINLALIVLYNEKK